MPSKANGYGTERQNHPARQVHREAFQPGDLLVTTKEPHKGGMLTSSRGAESGPTLSGAPIDTATGMVPHPEKPYRTRQWSKPNPGNYSPDEISNILRDSY